MRLIQFEKSGVNMSDDFSEIQTLLKKWNSLTIADNFIFTKVMQNERLCRHTLELLLGIKVKKLVYPSAESYFKDSFDSRGIRLDVYTSDDEHCYDIEMQTSYKSNLLLRSRYYSSCIDVDVLKTGIDFARLKENVIIFLCLEDPFKKGLPLYTFTTTCREDPNLPDDKTKKLFYNISSCRDTGNKELRDFFKFIKTNVPQNNFTQDLAIQVKKAIQNANIRRQYMTLQMEMSLKYNEGKKLGLELGKLQGIELGKQQGMELGKLHGLNQGMAKAKLDSAVIAVKKFNLPVEDVAREYGVPVDEIKKFL